MTYRDALKVIQENLNVAEHDNDGINPEYNQYRQDQVDGLRLAKVAIEKQIPKKPHKHHYPTIIKKGVCPRCLQTEDDSANYCRACGQALDWSEEDE